MNILYGSTRRTRARSWSRASAFASPGPATRSTTGSDGAPALHAHPCDVVAENIVLATEPRRGGVLLDYDAADRRVRDLADTFRFKIDPKARIENISVGQQQRVEILKALYRGADVLILDEPTAVLTPQEALELFGILRNLTREGMSVIFITHKLNEVLEIADACRPAPWEEGRDRPGNRVRRRISSRA